MLTSPPLNPLRRWLSVVTPVMPILGIDVGGSACKFVCLERRGDRRTVTRAGTLNYTADDWQDPVQVMETITHWLASAAGTRRGHFSACLPSSASDYEALTATTPPSEEPQQLAAWAQEAWEDLLGAQVKQCSMDFWWEPTNQGTLHLAWTPSQLAIQVSDAIRKLGWYCDSLEIAITALADVGSESQVTSSSHGDHRLVLDINANEVTCVYVTDGVPSYHRNRIQIASASAPELLAAKRGLSLETATRALSYWGVRKDCGLALADTHEACLQEWLEGLTYELQRTLKYVSSRYGNSPAPRIILCGGGSELAGLDTWLTEQTESTVEIAGMPADIDWQTAEPYSSRYAQALALVAGGISA